MFTRSLLNYNLRKWAQSLEAVRYTMFAIYKNPSDEPLSRPKLNKINKLKDRAYFI